MKRIHQDKSFKKILPELFICFLLYIYVSLVIKDYLFIRVLFSFTMGVAFSLCLKTYVSCDKQNKKKIALGLMLLVFGTIPLINNQFLYGDDYWGFGLAINQSVHMTSGISLNRPLNAVLFCLADSISFSTSNIYRTVSILMCAVCYILMYVITKRHHGSDLFAFFFSSLFFSGLCFVDSIAYMSVSTVFYSMFLSIAAYSYFEKAQTDGFVFYFLYGVLLFAAFCFYQITTPIVFVLFVIKLWNSKKEDECYAFKKAFLLLVSYGIVAITYLFASKLIQQMYGISAAQSARSEFVLTLDEILFKLKWFVTEVIPQSIYKIWSSFVGHESLQSNNIFYSIRYNSSILTFVIELISFVGCFAYFSRLVLKKRFWSLFISIVAIPLAFYPFLILPESYVLSYYMLPLLALILYYILAGWKAIWGICARVCLVENVSFLRIKKAIIVVVCIIVAYNSNAYSTYWVNYNRDSYMYMKQVLAQEMDDKTEKICVVGTISPIVGGNPYVVFSVERILEELEFDKNQYLIMQVDNPYYIATMTSADMEHLRSLLTAEEINRLDAFYTYDEMYDRYLYNYQTTQSDLDFLQNCLKQAEMIVLERSETDIIIDLSGFNKLHKF